MAAGGGAPGAGGNVRGPEPAKHRLVPASLAGSPRSPSTQQPLQFDRLVPNTWRVANSNDAVASVPRMLGYCHVSQALLGL